MKIQKAQNVSVTDTLIDDQLMHLYINIVNNEHNLTV